MEYDIHLSDATIQKLKADTGDSGGGDSGSGGDSDFSTAEVTFINSGVAGEVVAYEFGVCMIDDELTFDFITVPAGTPVTVTIPLYKGNAVLPLQVNNVDMNVMPRITGELSLDFDTSSLIIQGDGTFTAQGEAQQ